MTVPGAGWQRLAEEATVALRVPSAGRSHGGRAARGDAQGTGFFVAPDLVVTCAHLLLADGVRQADPPPSVQGRSVALGVDLDLEVVPDRLFLDEGTGLDLALLRVVRRDPADGAPPAVLLTEHAVGSDMWAFGHPDGTYRAGQPAAFTCPGLSRSTDQPGSMRPIRVTGVPVGPGWSGSPVVDLATGAVCGMLFSSNHAGSAHAIPISEIIDRCPELRPALEPVSAQTRWLSTLADTQLRAGGFRFVGGTLRRYLEAAERAARTVPYDAAMTKVLGKRLPDLSAIHVQRRAWAWNTDTAATEDLAADDSTDLDQARGERIPAEDILALDDDAVVVGAPGSGKSSLLHAGVMKLVHRWLAGRDPGWVPVLVHASDLTARQPWLPILSRAVATRLGSAAQEEWPAEFFQHPPLAGARWLVMVDGLDEVVSTQARREVVEILAGVRAQDPGHERFRILVASRPLPREDLAAAAGWHPRRFDMLPLDADQLPVLAQRWFTAVGTAEPARSADRFLDQVTRAGLTELARTPLMTTMLCPGPGPGPRASRPRTRPGAVAADKAYSSRANRAYLRQRGITAVIPEKTDQAANRKRKGSQGGRPVRHNAEMYKERNTVERTINRVKAWRGIATRYDKTPASYLVGLHLRASMIWIKELTQTTP
jgi:transposase